jgi:hypothetical protein
MKDIFKIPQGNYFSCLFSPELLTNGSVDSTLELQNLEVSFMPASGIARPVSVKHENEKYVIELPTDFSLGLYGLKFVGTLTNGRPVKFIENPFVEVTANELYTPENVLFEYSLNSLNVPTYPEQEQETEDQVIPQPSDTPNLDEDPGQGSLVVPEESQSGNEGSDEGSSEDAGGSESGEQNNESNEQDNDLSQEQEGGE